MTEWPCCRHCDHARQPAPHSWACPVCQYGKQARVEATQQRRRSNAAGAHGDRRTKRERDRSSSRRKAIEREVDA